MNAYHENVARRRDLSADFKQPQQVRKLPVEVSTYGDRRSDGLDVALLNKKFLDHVA